MNIIDIFSHATASTLVPRKTRKGILILISSREDKPVKLNDGWYKVLQYVFDDADKPSDTNNPFTIEMAQNMLSILIENIDADIFIACQAGISRSAGIAVALEEIFNSRDASHRYPNYNKYIKNMVKDAFYKKIWLK